MADLATAYTLTAPGGTINFNTGDLGDGTDKFWITSIQGLDGPVLRTPFDPVPFGDGSLIHTFRKGGRQVTFDGVLILEPFSQTDCIERWNEMEDDLRAALESCIDANATLTWTPAGLSARSLAVYNVVTLDIKADNNYRTRTFSFGLISPAAEWT